MTDIANSARGVIPASTMLLMALTIGGIMLHEQPFKPSRPSEHGVEKIESRVESRVDVPQWEDPFKEAALVVQASQKDSKSTHPACNEDVSHLIDLKNNIITRLSSPKVKLQVFLITTASGFTHNSVELRRRQRMALAQAMVEAKFTAENSEHLSYLTFPSIVVNSSGGSGDDQLSIGEDAVLMPYEWFTRSDEREAKTARISQIGEHINLVLWVQGADIFKERSSAIVSLEIIIKSILDQNLRKRSEFAIIGPSNSDELNNFIQNVNKLAQKQLGQDAQRNTFRMPVQGTPGNRQQARLTSTQHPRLATLQKSPWGFELCQGPKPASDSTDHQPDQPETNHSSAGGVQANIATTAATAQLLIDAGIMLSSVETMQDIAITYLDKTPEGTDREEIRDCISTNASQDRITKCLGALGIEDSDDTWNVTVAGALYFRQEVAKQSNIYESSESEPADRDFAAFVLMADAYLDEGWQTVSSADVNEIRAVANCDSSNQNRLSNVLANKKVNDTDLIWDETLAKLFKEGYCKNRTTNSIETPVALASPDSSAPGSSDSDGVTDVSQPIAITENQPQKGGWDFAKWQLYSPRATVENEKLFEDDLRLSYITRTIADDRKVTDALVKELWIRGVALCNSDTRIDLVSEGGSLYGTSYKKTFEEAVNDHCPGDGPGMVVKQHFFFAHAEGEHAAPHGKSADSVPIIGGVPLSGSGGGINLELPTGAHQLDYIRRLAKTVSQNKKDISAIGIIGSDVYDKQLIIEALRTYLPGKLIFTTDADALYEHPSFYRFNQNLLVASSYGLTVPKYLEFPTDIEFRDNYQTSFYIAVRQALKGVSDSNVDLSVKLFEVGRSGLIDISPYAEQSVERSVEKSDANSKNGVGFLEYFGISERNGWKLTQRDQEAMLFQLLFLLFPILVLVIFLWGNRRMVLTSSLVHVRRKEALDNLIQLGVVVFILSLIGLVVWRYRSTFEPFFIFEGISAAPTVMFRVSAMLFAISLIVFIQVRMTGNQRELTRYFGLRRTWKHIRTNENPEIKRTFRINSWEDQLSNLVTRSHRIFQDKWKPPTSIDVWDEYQRLGDISFRFKRVLGPWVIIMVLIFWVAYGIYDQPHLVRYNTFIQLNWKGYSINGFNLFTFGSIALSTLAILIAGDALRLCTVFVRWQEYDFVAWLRHPTRSVYCKLGKYSADRLASVEIIMRRTEVMRQVIILPFIVLFLQMVARSRLFEGWTWNPGIVTIYTGFALYLFYRSARLQQAANRARRNVIDDLEREASNLRLQEIELKSTDLTSASEEKKQAYKQELATIQKHLAGNGEVISYIAELKRGLFRPLLDHPLFQAIAWPSTGLGLLALMQIILN